MLYITFTHVDALTGIPVTQEPARNGPTTPAGARFGFALESRYPLPPGTAPIFYGTILAADDHTAPGILSVITKAEYDTAKAAEMDARREPLIERCRLAIQEHLDAAARSRRYENGVSLASYATSSVPAWAAEAGAFVPWRDAVWAHAYELLDAVRSGARPAPTIEDLIAELPALRWPDESAA